MAEDTRPKVTMTKNQLTALLGIELLMKKNSKSKTFSTMLDIICNFLVDRKEDQDDEPSRKKHARPDDKARIEKRQEPVDKWGFDPPEEHQPPTPQHEFYGNEPPARPKTGVRPGAVPKKEDDEWDLEDKGA